MSTTKDERLQLRVSPDDKRLIERAASTTQQTLTEFVVRAAASAAREIVPEAPVLELSAADWDALQEALAAPAAVNERLLAALGREQKFTWVD